MPWWDPQTWDWATLVNTVIGAGAGTALIAIYRDRRQRKSRAAYMAMRLAVTFEAYASACSGFISYNDAVQPPPDEEEFPHWLVELPELPSYPDDPDGWQAIDRKLAARCLNFCNKIQESKRIIGSTIEYNMDDLGDVLDEQAAGCGLEARKLAAALRHKHGVEEVNTGWDCGEHLESALRKAKMTAEERRELRSQNAREISSLVSELQIDEQHSNIR